jgi:formate dehydrogenase
VVGPNGAKTLVLRKRGTYLVNTARAKLVDRDAIVKALESGQLAGYAGDVWYPQPAPANHPWRTMPHEGMTPHTSGSTLSAQARYSAGTREILECFYSGRPPSARNICSDRRPRRRKQTKARAIAIDQRRAEWQCA